MHSFLHFSQTTSLTRFLMYCWYPIRVGVFILAFFIVWGLLLAIFKCLGQRKIGMFSGSPMRAIEGSKKPMIVRIVFVISAIMVVTFAALLVTEGLTQLKSGVVTVYDSSVEVGRILGVIDDFANALEGVGDNVAPIRDELVNRVSDDNFCAGVDLNAVTGIDFDSLTANVVEYLNEIEDYTGFSDDIQEATADLRRAAQSVEETSENITPRDWQSLMFIVPFSVFAVVFVVGVALAWCGRSITWYTCILSWFVLPLFILLVVVCFIVSGGIAIAASINAGRRPFIVFRTISCDSFAYRAFLVYQISVQVVKRIGQKDPLCKLWSFTATHKTILSTKSLTFTLM